MIEIEEGIAYQNKTPVILHIIEIQPKENYLLVATFSDGVTKQYDCSPLLKYEAFRSLRNKKKFQQVSLNHGVPTWEEEKIDLSPETLYLNGQDV